MPEQPRSAASKVRAALAAARAVVAAWDRLRAPPRSGDGGALAIRVALADAVSRLRDELAKL